MAITICSRWCYPHKNPRAFRTFELLTEFIRREEYVYSFLPDTPDLRNKKISNIVYVSDYKRLDNQIRNFSADECVNKIGIGKKLFMHMKKLFFYLFNDTPYTILYAFNLLICLFKNREHRGHDDVIISISNPFYIHMVVVIALKILHQRPVMIADCGDPFYFNPSRNVAPYLRLIEKWVLSQFDYISIPIEAARSAYNTYGIDNKIRIIPQGFNLIEVTEDEYKRNFIPTFCYAGVFYENIRNPEYFFEYIKHISNEFKFVVYALPGSFTESILAKYKKFLGDKLEVYSPIEREKLIHIMAKMDFVINFDNDNSTQKPSKLIDYAMSKRPILSFNKATFDKRIFQEFLNGDYHNRERIDLSQYDIRTVVDKFEVLFAANNK